MESQEGVDVPWEQVVDPREIDGGVSLKRRRLEVKERAQQISRLASLRASTRSIKELILVLGSSRNGALTERGHGVHLAPSLCTGSEEPKRLSLANVSLTQRTIISSSGESES